MEDMVWQKQQLDEAIHAMKGAIDIISQIKKRREEKTKVNWVVFTQDGFGFALWVEKDWRGDLGDNWDDTVKTFQTVDQAREYILMNKPLLSLKDLLDNWYSWEELSRQHLSHSADFYRNETEKGNPHFQRFKKLAKEKLNK